MLLRLFHLSVATLYWYTVWYDLSFINIPFPDRRLRLELYPLKGRVLFLTFWCLIMQTTYFTICVLNDYFGTNVANPKQSPIIRAIKDKLFILAFPTAFYVAVGFWGIYTVDKDLMFPDHVAKDFPPWVNHTMHSLIVLFVLLELVLCYRRYPSRSLGYPIVVCFNMAYLIWFHCVWYQTGVWAYPIFTVLNWPARGGFFVASTAVALMFYRLGENLNGLVWSKMNKQKVKSK